MRILHIIPYFSPKMGGSPQVVFQAANQLSQRGHQVTVIASDFGTPDASFPGSSFQVKLFPNLFARWGFYFSPGMYTWLRQHITEYDVLHLHEVRTFQNIAARALAVRHHIPYAVSAHGTLPVIIERHTAKRVFDSLFGKRILDDASKLVAVSPVEVEQYQQAGIAQERIMMIYNGLNLAEFQDLPASGSFRRQHPEIEKSAPIILSLGRLHKIKGIPHLIEAFAVLVQEYPQARLVIAGPDEGEQPNLQLLARRLELEERVHFVGALYGRNKLAAYLDASMLASTAAYEIFGLVPFEALLCGTPVIVSDDCGTGQMLSEADAGYLVRYGEVGQLAETMKSVLSHPDEAARRVANGQAFVREKLDWAQVAGEFENLYQELVKP